MCKGDKYVHSICKLSTTSSMPRAIFQQFSQEFLFHLFSCNLCPFLITHPKTGVPSLVEVNRRKSHVPNQVRCSASATPCILISCERKFARSSWVLSKCLNFAVKRCQMLNCILSFETFRH